MTWMAVPNLLVIQTWETENWKLESVSIKKVLSGREDVPISCKCSLSFQLPHVYWTVRCSLCFELRATSVDLLGGICQKVFCLGTLACDKRWNSATANVKPSIPLDKLMHQPMFGAAVCRTQNQPWFFYLSLLLSWVSTKLCWVRRHWSPANQ